MLQVHCILSSVAFASHFNSFYQELQFFVSMIVHNFIVVYEYCLTPVKCVQKWILTSVNEFFSFTECLDPHRPEEVSFVSLMLVSFSEWSFLFLLERYRSRSRSREREWDRDRSRHGELIFVGFSRIFVTTFASPHCCLQYKLFSYDLFTIL